MRNPNSPNQLISVCMATYNGEKYIRQQLESILQQLGPNDEIIISDDSSTDSTLEIVRSFNDQRIKVLSVQSFKNPIFNFENALKVANGQVIFLSDQDDVWVPDKVSICMNALTNHDLIVSDCTIIDGDSNIMQKSFFVLNGSRPGIVKNIFKNSYLGCCLAFKREVLNVALPFPRSIPMHDWWIGLIGELFFRVKFVNNSLVLYRRHGYNASPSGEKSKYSLKTKFLFRYSLVKNLIKLWLG